MTSGKETYSELEKPLLIFDGDCGFCRYWVRSWKFKVGNLVNFAPSQKVKDKFPNIEDKEFDEAVQLVTTDGQVFSGAEAVFRTLSYNPGDRWMLWFYRNIPGVPFITEAIYRAVATNRALSSRLTDFFWGQDAQPSTYVLSSWLFIRLFCIIYFFAFLSLSVQVQGLYGSQGILPVKEFLHAVKIHLGGSSTYLVPSLLWFNSSDQFLQLLTTGGAALSIVAAIGLLTGPLLVVLWLIYLSFATAGQSFLSFQWDALLLEVGFLAILLTGWKLKASHFGAKKTAKGAAPPSMLVIWLLRLVLFKLVFLSGAVKLLSGDQTYRNLTALTYHFETQPLPTPPAWLFDNLPFWFLKFSCVSMFVLELAVPFLIFAPRRLRFAGGYLLIFLQLLIMFTGNYTFFNLLALLLCIPLFDDQALSCIMPESIKRRVFQMLPPWSESALRRIFVKPAAIILLIASITVTARPFIGRPPILGDLVSLLSPLRVVSSYGVFAIMTTTRPEIIVEGSADGKLWLAYEFKYKPGALNRPPPVVAPHQPRLDWQMWFAALGTYHDNPWFVSFMRCLLDGSQPVLNLLQYNPFPDAPPQYVRALVYEYHFTSPEEFQKTGNWWKRKLVGTYMPKISLNDFLQTPD